MGTPRTAIPSALKYVPVPPFFFVLFVHSLSLRPLMLDFDTLQQGDGYTFAATTTNDMVSSAMFILMKTCSTEKIWMYWRRRLNHGH